MSKTIDLGRVVGNSAYEDAVANGYTGTLQEWLASLKGEKGERGEQGLQGIQGEKGDSGQNGADGRDGTNGTNGQDGADGQDGVSPSIEINTISGGHQVIIKDKAHPQGQSFNVMDGEVAQTGTPVSLTFTYEDNTSVTYSLLTAPSNNS